MHHIIIVIHIKYKFHEIPFSGYIVMAPDRRTERRTDGHGQTYISPPSAGDKKRRKFDVLKSPEALEIEGNLSKNWKKWLQRFEFYLTATGISAKEDKIKTSAFLHVIGPDALKIYNTFKFDNPDDNLKL